MDTPELINCVLKEKQRLFVRQLKPSLTSVSAEEALANDVTDDEMVDYPSQFPSVSLPVQAITKKVRLSFSVFSFLYYFWTSSKRKLGASSNN